MRLPQAHTRLEAAHHFDPIEVAVDEPGADVVKAIEIDQADVVNRNEDEGRPLGANAKKFRGGNARNDKGVAVDQNGFAEGGGTASKPPLPETAGNRNDWRGARLVVLRTNEPAQGRPDS